MGDWLLASDTPTWVTLGVAVVAAAASIAAAIFAARTQRGTAHWTATSDRFAPWQVLKREVYSDLLAAAAKLGPAAGDSERSDPANRASFLCECDRAMLYAYADTRPELLKVYEQPDALADAATWRSFVDTLRNDVLREGQAD
jgi:hypothetical protein